MLSIVAARPQPIACYEQYYGLAQRPFGLTPDQRFRYPARSFRAALEEIRHALQRREGLVIVTGDSGTGKTMLCRTLLQELDTPVCVSLVLDPCLSIDDLLRQVLRDFGVLGPDYLVPVNARQTAARHELASALQQFLLSLVPLGTYAVIVIDEAQHLDAAVLEQLRLLLNYETDESKLLQLVLVGQPDLGGLLERPEMQQLAQRVARRCVLQPLAPHEVTRYIERRVSAARQLALSADGSACEGGDSGLGSSTSHVAFTPSASAAVATLSRGIPRLVNVVCDHALAIACERRTHIVDRRIVRAAGSRVRATIPPPPPQRSRAGTAAAAAAVVLVAATAVWTWASTRSAQPGVVPPAASVAPPPREPARGTLLASSLASGSRFKRAQFEQSAGGVSLVMEMDAEPQKIVTNTDGRTWLAVDIGPIDGVVPAQELAPAAGMPFVERVAVDGFAGPNRDVFARARITLRRGTRTDVRVVGSRVYVDFRAPEAARPRASELVRYRNASEPIVARLTEIGPFLVSASAAPTPEVLGAVAETLRGVSESLRVIAVPEAAAPAHTLLNSAVSLAARAVTPEFDGDRSAQAHRALALVEAARVQMP